MSSQWTLTDALSAVDAEAWSGTRFGAVGLLQPEREGRVRFDIHTPAAIASSVLDVAQLQPGGALERLRSMWQLGPVERTPVGIEGAELYAARRQAPLESDDVRALVGFARRVEDVWKDGEPPADRVHRLTRAESVAEALPTLSASLDIREVFGQLSATARRVLPHDFATVFAIFGDRRRVRMHALSLPAGVTVPDEVDNPYPTAMTEGWIFAIHHDLSLHPVEYVGITAALGLRSSIRIPIVLDGVVSAGVNFSAFEPNQYTTADVPVARRIADYITLALSHQRLAEDARDAASLRVRAANTELLDQLLTKLSDAGELPDIFDGISAIAQRVLPHDILGLPVLLPGGTRARIYARSGGNALPVPDEFDLSLDAYGAGWEFDLNDDIQVHPGPRDEQVAKLGCRSVLRVPVRIEGKFAAALAFLSMAPAVYSQADVPIARRMADRIALLLARERGLAALRRADEAAARAAKLEARVRALSEELDARTGYRRVVGASPVWKQVVTQAAQVAPTDTTVLLLGESGTGKEVVARLIHRGSARADGPFVALNCAALPEQLLEAELFGYERGAFTGAAQSKPGQLEQAGGGTLFLDEVGEMSPQVQAKFLRVLQEKEFQRLGGTRVLRTDVRVVAATNRDLQQAMSRGQFREDLYYRLNVFAIRLPPLRDRSDDVLPLSEVFLAEYGRSLGRPPSGISKEARTRLKDYRWPGNVRELRNILERAAILCDGGLITPEHLAIVAAPAVPPPVVERPQAAAEAVGQPVPGMLPPPLSGDLAAVERAMIEQALHTARFNKSKAAAALGLTRAQLYVRMRKHGLE